MKVKHFFTAAMVSLLFVPVSLTSCSDDNVVTPETPDA